MAYRALKPALDLLDAHNLGLHLTERSRTFLDRIDQVGRYRYMEASFFVDWHWIVALDQAVWQVRRFCTLDARATSAMLVEGQRAPRVRIVGGHLEKILAKPGNPAREPLLWHNAYFGRGRRTVTIRGGLTAVNSPLIHAAGLIDEILEYAYIPRDVVKVYRKHVRGDN